MKIPTIDLTGVILAIEETDENYYMKVSPSYTMIKKDLSHPNSIDPSCVDASWINGYDYEHAFIASPGPLETTVEQFWHLLWQVNVKVIVMAVIRGI